VPSGFPKSRLCFKRLELRIAAKEWLRRAMKQLRDADIPQRFFAKNSENPSRFPPSLAKLHGGPESGSRTHRRCKAQRKSCVWRGQSCFSHIFGECLMKRIHFLSALLVALTMQTVLSAAFLEDFRFNDPNNTSLGSAANSANPGNQLIPDTDHNPTIQVLGGSLNIVKNDTSTVNEGLDFDDVSSGTLWVVAAFKGWAFPGPAISTDVEDIRFGFMGTEDIIPPPSSTVLAEMLIRRNTTTGGMELLGTALGAGGTNTPAVAVNTIQTERFTMAMRVDQDNNVYEVYYKDGVSSFVSVGTGTLEPTRDALVFRFTVNNFIGDVSGEFANLDRFFITTRFGLPEPGSATLLLVALIGWTGLRRF
jgi:hypothetical protein